MDIKIINILVNSSWDVDKEDPSKTLEAINALVLLTTKYNAYTSLLKLIKINRS